MKVRIALLAVLATCASGWAAPPQDVGPPTVNGLYVAHKACPGEGCEYGSWRAAKAMALRVQAQDGAKIVATLVPKERVRVLTGDLYVVPWRGVATANGQGLKKGDVVYVLGDEGEGDYTAWRKGELLSLNPEEAHVRWAVDIAKRPASIWWVRLKRSSGQTGWVRAPDGFECIGKLAGDEGC